MILTTPTIATPSRITLINQVVDYLTDQKLCFEMAEPNDHQVESYEFSPSIEGVWKLDILAEVSTHNDEVYNKEAHVTILDVHGKEIGLTNQELLMLSKAATENILVQ